MKKLFQFSRVFFLLSLGTFCFSSCQKEDVICEAKHKDVPESELKSLANFLEENDLEAKKDNRGFYYQIVTNGSSNHPTACSDVMVDYVGKLKNGHVFDSNNKVSFDLRGVIIGWQMGLPLIGEGGKIILYLPPTLAYGIQGTGGIPSNAITVFEITLLKVNN